MGYHSIVQIYIASFVCSIFVSQQNIYCLLRGGADLYVAKL